MESGHIVWVVLILAIFANYAWSRYLKYKTVIKIGYPKFEAKENEADEPKN